MGAEVDTSPGTTSPGTPASAGRPFLTTQLDVSILRGVRIDKALMGCGATWSSNAFPSPADAAYAFDMSTPVSQIDDFVTHDWQTSRWRKHLTFCTIHNARIASFYAALVVALPAITGIPAIPLLGDCPTPYQIGDQTIEARNTPFLFAGLAVFWFLFFFWQSVQGVLLPSQVRHIFVDKFCIHQTDNFLKKRGILSLAGFMKHSNRLVILWSTKYFSRLWCAYEVASWLHLGRDFEQVLFVPVDVGIFFSVVSFAFTGAFVMVKVLCIIVGGDIPTAFAMVRRIDIATFAVRFICMFWAVHRLRAPARALLQLPKQLEDFSVREAECFCCSNGHLHPETGAKLSCDRKLVYSTLVKWFGSDDEAMIERGSQGHVAAQTSEMIEKSKSAGEVSLDDPDTQLALDAFDRLVHTDVMQAISTRRHWVIPMRLPYRHVLVMGIFLALYWLDIMPTFRDAPAEVKARMLMLVGSLYFLAWPLVFKLILTMVCVVARRERDELSAVRSLILTFEIVLLAEICWESLWALTHYAASLENPRGQIGITMVLALLTASSYAKWSNLRWGKFVRKGGRI